MVLFGGWRWMEGNTTHGHLRMFGLWVFCYGMILKWSAIRHVGPCWICLIEAVFSFWISWRQYFFVGLYIGTFPNYKLGHHQDYDIFSHGKPYCYYWPLLPCCYWSIPRLSTSWPLCNNTTQVWSPSMQQGSQWQGSNWRKLGMEKW